LLEADRGTEPIAGRHASALARKLRRYQEAFDARAPPGLRSDAVLPFRPMREDELRDLLSAVAAGEIGTDEAVERLARLPFLDLGDAKLDLHREIRNGVAEAVFAPGKTTVDLERIVDGLVAEQGRALITRLDDDQARLLRERHPAAAWHPRARILTVGTPAPQDAYTVAVLTAGTSDVRVAEEAALVSEWLGGRVDRHYDVGVAGVHRLLGKLDVIRRAAAILVVAGMDGALPTLVAGLVRAPVIAVPTSVGYGASFGGLAALLTMLNACSPGVAVVNIDNGYGAAVMARRICARRDLRQDDAPPASRPRTSRTDSPARSPRGTPRGPARSRRTRRPA
jgi:NCAIR mutase (PurE)-related protein